MLLWKIFVSIENQKNKTGKLPVLFLDFVNDKKN